MKSILVTMLVCGTVLGMVSGGEKKYGKDLTVKEGTSLSRLLSKPEEFNGKRVLIEGVITEVCQKKGCWIRVVEKAGGEAVQVKVEDDVIVFPKDGKGKKVRAEGTVSVTTLSTEELVKKAKHEAEEQGKLREFDPSKIKGPKTVVRIEGEGAVIRD